MKKTFSLSISMVSLLAVGLLSGCNTLSKRDCEEMNWEQAGYQAALKGEHVQEDFNRYQNSCRQAQVILKQEQGDAFARGYDKGRELFCTPEYAHKYANDGGVYRGICPDSKVNSNFMTSYQSGRETFFLRRISELESQVSSLRSQLSSAQSEADSLRGRACP